MKSMTNLRSHVMWIALTFGLSAGLMACSEKNAQEVAANAPEAKANTSEANEENYTEKFNAYTKGYNTLIGTFGLLENQANYIKQNISKKQIKDFISISDGWIPEGRDSIKTGRALPTGNHAQLDQAADKLIAELDKLLAQLDVMGIYYSSKAYIEDNLAKGKAQDKDILANYDSSVAALKVFNAELTKEQQKIAQIELDGLKSSGDMLGYHTKLAIQKSEEVINLFENEADINNPELYNKADALVVDLDGILAEQRKAYAMASENNASPDVGFKFVASSLVDFIGEYRTMKQSKKPADFNRLIKKYNSAIESRNRIRS